MSPHLELDGGHSPPENGEQVLPATSRRLHESASHLRVGQLLAFADLFHSLMNLPGQDGPPALFQSSPQVDEGGEVCFCFLGEGQRLPLTGIDLLSLRALLAFHVAAPAHLALAGPGYHPALGVVAPAAADGVAVLVLVALCGQTCPGSTCWGGRSWASPRCGEGPWCGESGRWGPAEAAAGPEPAGCPPPPWPRWWSCPP